MVAFYTLSSRWQESGRVQMEGSWGHAGVHKRQVLGQGDGGKGRGGRRGRVRLHKVERDVACRNLALHAVDGRFVAGVVDAGHQAIELQGQRRLGFCVNRWAG